MTRRYAWIVVGLLWIVAALNYLDRQIIFSVFPILETDLNLTPGQLGLVSAAFLWVYAVVSPFAGYLADRFGGVRMILIGLFVWSVVTWATGEARGLTGLLSARAFMGVSEACYLPAALSLIAAYHDGGSRSLATGLHQSGLYVGIALGGVGGGWMADRYGWRLAFTLLGAAGVAYFLILRFTLRAPRRSDTGTVSPPAMLASFRHLANLPGFLSMMAVFSVTSIANWLVYTWLPFTFTNGSA